ncbi:flavodoxin [Levilactobacillus cerevisiae]|uniref:flavodoxin n=1 Tax=Levilactobacillus cerevisiae TaxID=1704076 RepID=UPI00345EF4CE
MSKKTIVSLILLALLIFGGGYYAIQRITASTAATSQTQAATTHTSKKNGKALILYYSNSGTTETAAKYLQRKTGADLIKLKLSPAYPTDYGKLVTVAKRQINRNSRPKITNTPNLKSYKTIYLGFPTWYHRPPMFINTFFEANTLRGKTVIPFTTSMSSPISVSTPYLKRMAKGKALTLQPGFRANNESTINRYLKQHHLID